MLFEYINKVKCTKEEAWQLIIDIERRPDWIHFQEKCYWTDKKPGMVGSRYQEVEVFLGFHMNVNYEVIEWVDHVKMKSKCMMPPFHQTVEVTVSEETDGVICTLRIEANMGVLGLLPKSFIKKQVDNLIDPFTQQFIHILESESSLRNR